MMCFVCILGQQTPQKALLLRACACKGGSERGMNACQCAFRNRHARNARIVPSSTRASHEARCCQCQYRCQHHQRHCLVPSRSTARSTAGQRVAPLGCARGLALRWRRPMPPPRSHAQALLFIRTVSITSRLDSRKHVKSTIKPAVARH